MKKSKRMLSLLFAVSLGVTPVVNCVSNMNTSFAEEQNDEEKIISSYAEELKFYFETVGHFDENDKYTINNYYLLKQRALFGDEFAKKLVAEYENRSIEAFLWCVLKDQTYGVLDFLSGDSRKALITALAGGSWKAAGKIMYMAMKQAGKLAGRLTNQFYNIASLAMSAYSCRNEY